jgi:hypothetical protein
MVRWSWLSLPAFALALAGCSSAASAPAQAAARPGDGSVRERLKAQAPDAEPEAREVSPAEAERDTSGFDFGRGPVKSRQPRADSKALDVAPVAGQGIRITWEALTVEREQIANPRRGRKQVRGAAADQKIVLVSQDHPTAVGREQGKARKQDQDGGQFAVLPTEEMTLLVRGLRQSGFYRVARPTGALAAQFDDESARGRVTIEVQGESMTVLSMRGQGASPATKDIPRVYSEAKQAVAALRNATPTLNVLTAGKEPNMAPGTVRRRGQGRILTAEEAASILGEEAPAAADGKAAPAAPADDGWLGR